MLIDHILHNAKYRYETFQGKKLFCGASCPECTNIKCTGDCGQCLRYIHWPQEAEKEGVAPRKYDCPNMADYYICKFACRYTSEMIYALEILKDLRNRDIKVLSFGCGPCTDLLAIDYLQSRGALNTVEYRGIDYEAEMWKQIHSDIKDNTFSTLNVNFFYHDICDMINEIAKGAWIPDVVIFQYLFSDMHKHSGETKTITFIEKFTEFANKYMAQNSYIVINDINLTKNKQYYGGREYFDILYNRLIGFSCRRGRFHNDEKSFTYPYGPKDFENNKNIFPKLIDEMSYYSPLNTCASARLIAKKDRVE